MLEFDLGSQLALLSRLGFDSPRVAQLGLLLAAATIPWLAAGSSTRRDGK